MENEGSLTASLWAMIEAAQASANQEEPGDYVKDGLLYCGKCHTPKQAIVNVCGEMRTVFAACECKERQNKKEEADLKMHERRQRIEQLRKAAFSESDMQDWTFENDDSPNSKPSQIARNYTKNFREMMERGKGLIFYGTVGTGKTYLAACIANALIDKGIPCIVTSVHRFLNTMPGMFEGRQEYIDKLNSADLLILDDLESERDTEFTREMVYSIIDGRYRAKLPLIVTTNLTAEKLKNPAEMSRQRTYSRLLEMCIPVEVKGADRRREKLKEDYNDLKDVLGL